MKKKANELDGKTWLRYSFSIWRDIKKTKEERKLKHPAMFPIQLADRIINIWSKEGDIVLDPFLGSGSTMISSYKAGRKGLGLDLLKKYTNLSRRRVKEIQLGLGVKPKKYYKPRIITSDILKLGTSVGPNSVDLVITSPPYWNILAMKRSADRKEIKKYSESEKDFGNIPDYKKFLSELTKSFKEVYKTLKPGGHCVVVVMDIRKKSKFYPFHLDIITNLENLNYQLEDIVIWDRQKEYNNMRPLGYPYVFRVNKVHEYILIFKK